VSGPPRAGELEHVAVTNQVRPHIGLWVVDAVPNTGLRAEVDDAVDLRAVSGGCQGFGIGEIDPFEPEPLDGSNLKSLAAEAIEHAESVFVLLERSRQALSPETVAGADALLDGRRAILDELHDLGQLYNAGRRTRIHGDYHLGRVLRSQEDFVILDFEGEAAKPLALRRAKYSPLKDVASMLRSFHYAAYAALFAFAPASGGPIERLIPWADAWHHWVSRAFLSAYRMAMSESPLLPEPESFNQLLHALIVDKALCELEFELNSRPEWARIPLTALVTLALPLQR